MNATRRVASLVSVAALCLSLVLITGTRSEAQQTPAQNQQPQYTMPEYNAEQACASEKNPATQVKCLDDFVSKYPNSALLIYVYPIYVNAYGQLKNYPKVIEYADKSAALGDKIDAAARFNAYYQHAVAYSALLNDPANGKTVAQDSAMAKATEDVIGNALKTLDEVKKPDNITDDAWATQKKQFEVTLNSVGAQAAAAQKDYPTTIKYYKALLANDPDDPVVNYNLGRTYLALNPPQQMDAFWSIARGASSKKATKVQSDQLRAYLRKLIVNYQQAACDNLTDAELNELLQLASTAQDRPESYKLPSSQDLDAARKDMTILTVINDLKAGGDKAKVTWLAACGLEFPEVLSKVIDVTPGTDNVLLHLAFVTSDAEFEAATTPNMDVKIVGQPEAAHIEKNSAVHFTATLVSYDPDPFIIHWDKGKVKEEDLPKAKKPATHHPTTRKPNQ